MHSHPEQLMANLKNLHLNLNLWLEAFMYMRWGFKCYSWQLIVTFVNTFFRRTFVDVQLQFSTSVDRLFDVCKHIDIRLIKMAEWRHLLSYIMQKWVFQIFPAGCTLLLVNSDPECITLMPVVSGLIFYQPSHLQNLHFMLQFLQ